MSTNPRALAAIAVVSLLFAGCTGGSSSDGDSDGASSSENTTAAASDDTLEESADNSEPDASDEPPAGNAWTVQIGSENFEPDSDLTICLTLPGGTFVLNGAGTHPAEGEFQFFVSNEDGGEMSFQTTTGGGFVIVSSDDGNLEVDYADDLVSASGTSPDGTEVLITGTCS